MKRAIIKGFKPTGMIILRVPYDTFESKQYNRMKKAAFILLLGLLSFGTKNGICQSTDAYFGEIRLFPYTFVPDGWLECNGQYCSTSTYSDLFEVIGNTFGGDGSSTFCVPNLNGRVPVGVGTVDETTVAFAQYGGSATETMTESQLPAHTHSVSITTMQASGSSGTTTSPGYYAVNTDRGNEFNTTADATSATMSATVTTAGGTTARKNMQPYLVLIWCICADATDAYSPY